MKFILLAAATLVATLAHAQEYTTHINGSEQVTEIDFAEEAANIRCNGPVDNPCPSGAVLYKCKDDETNMCCSWTTLDLGQSAAERLRDLMAEVDIPGFGKCSLADVNTMLPSSSEDDEEVPNFLRGTSIESSLARNFCTCNSNRNCRHNEYCAIRDCPSNRAQDSFTGGYCRQKSVSTCNCDSDWDCRGNEYCWMTDCNSNRASFSFTGGRCRPRRVNNNSRACNFKQCEHKQSNRCSCSRDQFCVKTSNACIKSGNDNGCCERGEVAEGYFLG
eukprot:CAMPEP_0183729048 /NCGR_PEP_ID=MMETSP0737-20130205/29590_1 /TAXON_ID=385413 /ORGANISM="Thalassiosira miniscula, Strain CCMP1093" /LENGTH=274 /DNA_ID=CAMNT_0025961149 /DNA_START=87 /DNA_END=911 /DNA_ORIENTATION=+